MLEKIKKIIGYSIFGFLGFLLVYTYGIDSIIFAIFKVFAIGFVGALIFVIIILITEEIKNQK